MRRALLALALIVAGCGDNQADHGVDAARIDSTPASCGIEEPGTRCVDPSTLQRCNGTAIDTVDCAAQGRLCGPDPANQAAKACVATGDACGTIDNFGACAAGSVLVYCSSQSMQLVAVDCAALSFSECGLKSSTTGYDCVSLCELQNIPPEGECVAGGIHRCDFVNGHYEIVDDPCPAGTVCKNYSVTHHPACLPADSCGAIGPEGSCAGDTLTLCVAGSVQTTDCAATGEVCGFGGPATGYHCASPGATGAFAASGVVRYEDRPPLPEGLGALVPAPARGVAVAVVRDADGVVLASAVTADDGSYTLRYDAAAATQVHVLAATSSVVAPRPITVIHPDGLLHGIGSPSFAAAATVTQDLLATEISGEAEAFNVFDQMVRGQDYVSTTFADPAPPAIRVIWTKGGTDGTYYDFSTDTVFLLGWPSDDDGYDDAVVLHEFGHHVEDEYGHSDTTGGPHTATTPSVPRLAWSEGFATYFSLASRGTPIYMDSHAGGGWSYDGDMSITTATPTGPVSQSIPENLVTEILWDVADAPTPDDDPMTTGSHAQVLAVEHVYLRGPHTNRGDMGVDLVDWLDGWFVENGLASCAALRTIVATTHTFPYDFAGPAGVCP